MDTSNAAVRFEMNMTALEAVNICYRLQDTTISGSHLGRYVDPHEWHTNVCTSIFCMSTHTNSARKYYEGH